MEDINVDEILTGKEKEDLAWFIEETLKAILDLDERVNKLEEKCQCN